MNSTNELVAAASWQDTLNSRPSASTLNMLFEGQIAGLCIPSFLTLDECTALKRRAEDLEFNDYKGVEPRIGHIGVTVFEYDSVGKKEYFEASREANKSIAQITQGICHPLERAMNWLRTLSSGKSVDIAFEEGYGVYFAGLLRRIENGTLVHVDFAPLEQPNWAVAQITSQLAFNIYLDVPKDDPGVVRIWQKRWSPPDQAYKLSSSYGYSPELVKDIPCAQITPATGMMMLINTMHFHQVSPAKGSRLALSAAVGRTRDDKILVWS